jgi:molecular chaperone GrpE (heat shock protein)
VAKKDTGKTPPARKAARGGGVAGAEAAPKKATRRESAGLNPAAKRAADEALPPLHAAAEDAPARDDSRLDAVLDELRGVKRLIEQLVAPPAESDTGLDGSVDSLRRLLSELMERRMESVIKDIVEIRREAASVATADSQRIIARLEELLERLGAVRFEAEPLELVDPLIHVVVDERQEANVPEGLILETLRPGYRTARGLVVSKAAVAVNQRQ